MNWPKIQKLAGILIALQGVGHALIGTPMSFDTITPAAVWFAASGIAMMLVGLLNNAPWSAAPSWFKGCIIGTNLVWLLLTLALLSTSQSYRVIAAVSFAVLCLAGSVGRTLTEAE